TTRHPWRHYRWRCRACRAPLHRTKRRRPGGTPPDKSAPKDLQHSPPLATLPVALHSLLAWNDLGVHALLFRMRLTIHLEALMNEAFRGSGRLATMAMLGLLALQLECSGEVESVCVQPSAAERRAAAYLSREVRVWHGRNRCFSCHNNGDGARVLLWSQRFGLRADATALKDSLRWLATPNAWQRNGSGEPFNDRKLATIQFALALEQAVGSGVMRDQTALRQAGQMIVDYQDADGSWTTEIGSDRGSPTTYGKFLATALLVNLLSRDRERYRAALDRAEVWLAGAEPKSTVAAAALLLAGARHKKKTTDLPRCRTILDRNQAPDGGWGPDANSASEAFDTAVALLALRVQETSGATRRIQSGRAYLLHTQLVDGSWPETTRPALRDSYAQRVSTTAWALQALVTTRPGRVPDGSSALQRSSRGNHK
ncbi:MAG: prenyltransferase/squalene oxidase repeat-containing protein, partial [Planctomycetaceae bacterium]